MVSTKVYAYAGSLLVALAGLLLWAAPVAAQSGDSPVVLAAIADGQPVSVTLGCAYSDGPEYAFEQYGGLGCTSCSVYTCTFETDRPGVGGYVETAATLNYTVTVPTTGTWQLVQGSQTGVLWGDAPWTSTRYITFYLTMPTPTPTPTSTPTPTPTPTPIPTATPYYGNDDARTTYRPEPTAIPTLPNHGIWQNSPDVETSFQLLMPLPRSPDTSALSFAPMLSLPELELPDINPSADWPSLTMGRPGVLAQVQTQLTTARDAARSQYSAARASVAEARETIGAIQTFVGSPQSAVVASDGARQVTVVGMAQEMSQSISYSLSWLRAVGSLGPFGLDVVFLFIGLAWILFMNLLEWLMIVIAWLIKRVLAVFAFVIQIFRVLLEIVRTIMALLPFF